jgi:hypothetical protein
MVSQKSYTLLAVTTVALLAIIFAISESSAEPQRNPQRNNRFNQRVNQFGPPPPPPARRRPNNNRNNNRNNRQFNNNNNNNRRPATRRPARPASNNFRATAANARDSTGNEIYPGCNGTVCLPSARLCAVRKEKAGHFTFGGKSYWVSWASNEGKLRNARWNWFTGRNYCRKMCMDMVSFETKAEETFVHNLMKSSGIKDVHSSGRLCDGEVEGCDQPRFQPLHINGWFWASSLKMMPPTNQVSNRFYNNWSTTGPTGRRQPDGTLKPNGWGNEACMALLDNKYNDGLKWHDEPCNNRRVLVCEDLPVPNINFVRNQNPNIRIP